MVFNNLDIVRVNTPKDNIINEIIKIEWEMFQNVMGLNGRAPCQDDMRTFYIMRYSQHAAFKVTTLFSYKTDLENARGTGRNLIAEKYGYMMEYTDPVQYEADIKNKLPCISEIKMEIINNIISMMDDDKKAMEQRYPAISKFGRPKEDFGGNTSTHSYNIGELKTYSFKTLKKLEEDLKEARSRSENIVETIYANTMEFYGFGSLKCAEERYANAK